MLQDVPTMLGGRYRVVERLGRGGMADVYRAEDVVLRRAVAVKVFRGGMEREQHLARFRTEVRTLAALTHPHLVALYDAGGDVTEPWCAMEYVDGGSLADKDGPVPAAHVARIGEQIATGLAYVHARGIVHRDVKPSNVLLDSHGDAFLSDFGIAKLVDGTRMTQSGLMIGTAAFLSPEQVRGRTAGPESDVYALGLVLLEALTGHREYPGTPVESAVARLSRPPQVPEPLEADWGDLLRDMTAEEPVDRPPPTDVALRLKAVGRRLAGLAAGTAVAELPDVVERGVREPAVEAPVARDAGQEAAQDVPAGRAAAARPAAPAGTPAPGLPIVRLHPLPQPSAAGPSGLPYAASEVPSGPHPRNLLAWLSPERRRRLGAIGAAASTVVAVAVMLPLVDGGRAEGVRLDSSSQGTTPTSNAPAGTDGDDGLLVRRAPVGDLPLPVEDRPTTQPSPPQARSPRFVAGVATTRDPVVSTPTPVRSTPSASPSTPSLSPSPSPSPTGSPTSAVPTPSASPSASPGATPTGSSGATPTGGATGSGGAPSSSGASSSGGSSGGSSSGGSSNGSGAGSGTGPGTGPGSSSFRSVTPSSGTGGVSGTAGSGASSIGSSSGS